MAWRPTQYLLEGEFDNRTLGQVKGWLKFAGLRRNVILDLKGDFHRDIRGTAVRVHGNGANQDSQQAARYMEGFAQRQRGEVGDMTAGQEPVDYVGYPYFEWYGELNGRIVLELDRRQIEVIGKPVPYRQSKPISREEQNRKLVDFLGGLAQGLQSQPESKQTE